MLTARAPASESRLHAVGVDMSIPTGEIFRNSTFSLAEFESRVIYERLSKGKRQKASEGGYTGGWVPRRADTGPRGGLHSPSAEVSACWIPSSAAATSSPAGSLTTA